MDKTHAQTDPEVPQPAALLTDNDCWGLLRRVQVGRLAVVLDGEPEIFPVNYIVDHGTLVFRTADGTKLTAALTNRTVAFESDGFDSDRSVAWSVVVKGSASEIRELEDKIDASLLPLAPWHGGPKHRFVRIVPSQISGRQFAVVDGSVWHNPYTLRRTSGYE
ncbi:MAG TPA: pyridoxamine 5'-phosphate oxidase family protein [Kineosporiaceae bacterium]|nr:pyridoxamine 5'-phosphate oxidase family protein [Kineosporiaceae bacterium]